MSGTKGKVIFFAFKAYAFSTLLTALENRKGYVWAEMYVERRETGENVNTYYF